jgi:hypothetical protein
LEIHAPAVAASQGGLKAPFGISLQAAFDLSDLELEAGLI